MLDFKHFFSMVEEFAIHHNPIEANECHFIVDMFNDYIQNTDSLPCLTDSQIILLLTRIFEDELLMPHSRLLWFRAFKPLIDRILSPVNIAIYKQYSTDLQTLDDLTSIYFTLGKQPLAEKISIFEEQLTGFSAKYPNMIFPLFLSTPVYFYKGDFREAIRVCEKVLSSPHPPSISERIRRNLVILYYNVSDVSSAKKYALFLSKNLLQYFSIPDDEQLLREIGVYQEYINLRA
jgi:hypothetical protein